MKFMKACTFDVTDVASGESIQTAIGGASNNTMIAVGNAENVYHLDDG